MIFGYQDLYYRAYPPVLKTQASFFRITEAGTLLKAGQTIPTNIYHVESKVVPIASSGDYTFDAEEQAGFSTKMVVGVTVQLRYGNSLAQFLHNHYTSLEGHPLLEGESIPDFDTPSSVVKEVNAYLQPPIDELYREVQAQKTPVSTTSLLVRLRQIVEERKQTLPAWIDSIEVTKVDIQSWRQKES